MLLFTSARRILTRDLVEAASSCAGFARFALKA